MAAIGKRARVSAEPGDLSPEGADALIAKLKRIVDLQAAAMRAIAAAETTLDQSLHSCPMLDATSEGGTLLTLRKSDGR